MYPPEKIISELKSLLSENFNIENNIAILDREILLIARSKVSVQQYAISKKIVLDEINTYDFIIVWSEKSDIFISQFGDFCFWLERYAKSECESKEQHMRSRFIGFVIIDQNTFNSREKNKIKKYHKFRWLKLGLKGWYEIFFIVYFTQSFSWLLPRRGKEFSVLLENLNMKLKI